MKAAILTALHDPLVVADLTLPALQFGQVRVAIRASGICGSQLGEIDGVKGPDPYLPHLLGHEAAGVVQEIGPGVTTVQPDDHVVLHWRPGRGVQGAPARYRWGSRVVNAGPVTTFQEEAVVSENRVTAIPREIDFDIAALYGCAITTGFGVITNDARARPGESVVILGSGGVGLCQIMAAHMVSAAPIIAVDRTPGKLALAKACGATHTINTVTEDLPGAVRNIVGSAGADVVIDNTGAIPLMEAGYTLCGAQGRMILVGVPAAHAPMAIDTFPLHFDKQLRGSHGGQTDPARDIPRYLRLQQQGAFDPTALITHRFPLEEINTAIARMREGATGRCIIRMTA